MAKVYGIDLGTTYSCIATIDAFGQPEVLSNCLGNRTTPSVVYFSPDGTSYTVGDIAKNGQVVDYQHTISFIKREMGKDYPKPTQFPQGLTPTEISARILRKLVEDANNATDGPPSYDVVITCPAYFGSTAREQTKQAGLIAGLNVLRIINEPTAAAVAYGAVLNSEQEKYILVYDLGGGTFDISFIRTKHKEIEVLQTGGDAKLGGHDWDLCLAKDFLLRYNTEHNTDLKFHNNPALLNYMMLEAEKNKIILSAKKSTKVNLAWEGKSIQFEYTAEEFRKLTEHLVKKTLRITKSLLLALQSENGITLDDSVEVLLVGGSSRMPQISEHLKEFFSEYGCKVRLRDPNECVAKGAVLVAESEYIDNYAPSDSPAVSLLDVTSKTYGTDATLNGSSEIFIHNIIFSNTALPIEEEKVFLTTSENQNVVSIAVFESDSSKKVIPMSQGVPLDTDHSLQLPPGLPKGTQIQVKFSIGKEGILNVSATAGNSQIEFPVKLKGIMDEKELRKAKNDLGKMESE